MSHPLLVSEGFVQNLRTLTLEKYLQMVRQNILKIGTLTENSIEANESGTLMKHLFCDHTRPQKAIEDHPRPKITVTISNPKKKVVSLKY